MGLFGIFKKSQPDYQAWLKEGAAIVDVRSPGEFKSAHIKGSVNIPLNEIASKSGKLKADKPVIVCCQSGMRSAQAASILKQRGFQRVHNGGGWMRLQQKLN